MDSSQNQIASSIWNHSTDSQSLGFYQTNVRTSINVPDPSYFKDRNSLGSMPKGGVFLPDFFIDPALSVSCSASGSFNGIASPFDASEFSNSYAKASKGMVGAQFLSHGLTTQRPFEDATMPRGHGFHRGEAPDSTNESGDSSNKQKKTRKGMELDQVQGGLGSNNETANENALTKQKLEADNSTRTNVNSTDGKHANDGSNSPMEDYSHVRARHGQATNSHSLAERVRREKISERMKYLQDLVPGCSKVTGKAVMLDEIINYVQSLQRQVEFLSMKLATVNPRLDFNMDWLVPKYLHPPQQCLVQAGIPSDTFRRTVHCQSTSMNEFKEFATQRPTPWDNQIHDAVQPSLDVNPLMNEH